MCQAKEKMDSKYKDLNSFRRKFLEVFYQQGKIAVFHDKQNITVIINGMDFKLTIIEAMDLYDKLHFSIQEIELDEVNSDGTETNP